ncbi:LacI family DNA-binding transcriptional regulator [Arthrobacter agilis]|uniref:LacI family DNA-binding transcriptional regulator n=1 Tax=Arthrobacter agilis TaxID=37921 RepID=UPI002366C69F|nr:LacI family DNA-binding transcriptional regulator [Arthrobacter agilis]WDF33972.1 LacI family DNA-binding transcriptional regulator [Arthrobacter agilis]
MTLKDLAAELGIHVSTVSRVLHSESDVARGAASKETARRVRQLAQERGYSPDPQAASLRTRRTRAIGVIVPRLSDIVLATMYEGVEEAAAESNHSTFVMNSHDDLDEQRRKAEIMLARRVDGLILGDVHAGSSLVDDLTARHVPFVLMNRRYPGFPSSTCDDTAGGRLVADHLWSAGHRSVAIIAGESYASTGVDRTQGFIEKWHELGGDVPPASILQSRFDTEGGRQAGEELMRTSTRPPSAVFAVNDFAAIGAMGAFRSAGLVVGQDIAVVGFNDTSLAAQLPIPLTSVRSPMVEIGRCAVDMLRKVMNGERADSVRHHPELFVRESSAAAGVAANKEVSFQ